jgi:hypothetical protein
VDISPSAEYNSPMKYEWDKNKASTNFSKHGVAFEGYPLKAGQF